MPRLRREFDIEIDAETFVRILLHAPNRLNESMQQALWEEATAIFGDSQRRCPIDMGPLRASGQVHHPERDGNKVWVDLSYGGVSAPYARIVHESDYMRHDPPTQAHYLENAVLYRQPNIRRNIAERVARVLQELAV